MDESAGAIISLITYPSCLVCRILRWIREDEERIKATNDSPLKCVILDMTGTLSKQFYSAGRKEAFFQD